ncbi:MAG: hypothetical protein M3336_01015 [Chloroflexota bacterium]|nr:hypothetical protein [Chloroflexota bacterium]
MHDITELEALGLPAVFVASDAFMEAAEAQSRALGFDAPGVFVAHPIQDRTDAELRALAQGAVDEVVRALTTPP